VDQIPSLVNIPLAMPVPERRKKRNRKGKAATSEDVVMSDVEIAELGASGTKRALQDSPSKVEAPRKRSCKVEQGLSHRDDLPHTEDGSCAEEGPRIADKGVDLSGYEFDEETRSTWCWSQRCWGRCIAAWPSVIRG